MFYERADQRFCCPVYNTLRRNPFQTNTRGIDFTAHRQIKRQAEAQARAEAEARALAEAVGHQFGPESAYDEHDGLSRYAPTGIGASEIAPPGGSVFIPNRRSSRLHRTGTTSHYNDAFPPRRMTQPYGASRAGSVNYPAMYRRDSGSVIPDMSIHSRPRSPEFPAKGW